MKSRRFVSLSILTVLSAGLLAGISFTKNNNASLEVEAYYTPSTHYAVSDTPAKLASYYSSISDSSSGTTLLSALRSLNSNKRKSTVGYSGMSTSASSSAFIYTDYVLNSTNTDSNGQRYGTQIASFYTKITTTSFNKEHMWPKSHGGNLLENDILHTRPTRNEENSNRGNSFYVEGKCDGTYGWDPKTAGYAEWCRGECARVILYGVVANSNLNLTDSDYHATSNNNRDNLMGNINTLIKWHFAYTPNEYEINRNNGAEYLQGNRNPFVDHPEYVAKIWSNFNTTVSTLCNNNSSVYENWTVGSYSHYGTNDALTPAAGSVSLSQTSATVAVGDSVTVTATSSDSSAITWQSSNTSIATVGTSVSGSGTQVTINGVAAGNATITASATIGGNTYSKTCYVTVTSSAIDPTLTGITLDVTTATLNVDETVQLTVSPVPSTASLTDLVWGSTNSDVAKVNQTGLVKGVKGGQCTINVITADGLYMASCQVTVTGGSSKKGCGGSIIATSAILSSISLVGLGLLIIKRKKDK